MTMGTILALLTAVVAVGLLGYLTWRLGVAERDRLENRTEAGFDEPPLSLRDRLEPRLARTRPGRWMTLRLVRAGLGWRAIDALLILAGIATASFLFANRYMSWWFALLVAVGITRASLGYLDRRETQRREAFIAQLPELSRLLSNATSAGLALRSAISLAAEDLPEPAGSELQRVSQRLAVGTPIVQALDELHERLPSRELTLLTKTLIIQARAGGAVVTALREMSETLEARKELRREIRTLLSGAVFTSWVVLLLGVGAVVLLNAIAPGTLNRMTSTLIGQATVVVAAFLYVVGFLMIRRTSRIEV